MSLIKFQGDCVSQLFYVISESLKRSNCLSYSFTDKTQCMCTIYNLTLSQGLFLRIHQLLQNSFFAFVQFQKLVEFQLRRPRV